MSDQRSVAAGEAEFMRIVCDVLIEAGRENTATYSLSALPYVAGDRTILPEDLERINGHMRNLRMTHAQFSEGAEKVYEKWRQSVIATHKRESQLQSWMVQLTAIDARRGGRPEHSVFQDIDRIIREVFYFYNGLEKARALFRKIVINYVRSREFGSAPQITREAVRSGMEQATSGHS